MLERYKNPNKILAKQIEEFIKTFLKIMNTKSSLT